MSIYYGIRGDKFYNFLENLLKITGLTKQEIHVLLDNNGIKLYEQVFTHKSVHNEFNYEILEFLGDGTLNKSISWYLARRFPQLCCSKGVKILTRLKINLISKKSFSKFANTCHFWNFISITDEERQTKKNKVLEDVFEAFFGATEFLIDDRICFGLGYSLCYNIIKNLMDSDDISLKYEDLFDAKTRLKEIFDSFKETLGTLEYTSVRDLETKQHTISVVQKNINGTKIILAQSTSALKIDAEQKGAELAIQVLSEKGFAKKVSEDFDLFCK